MTESEDRRKHLEFVQAVIARQAGNSFLVKGWGLTVATVAFAFAVKERAWPVAVFGVLAVLAFWWLDSFFLRQERLYRCLYEAIIDENRSPVVPAFSMSTKDFKDNKLNRWPAVLKRSTVSIFFGVLAVTGLAAAVWACQAEADDPKTCRKDRASASSSSLGVA